MSGDPLALSLPFALSSPAPSTASSRSTNSAASTSGTSPSLFDLPTPPVFPASTPSPKPAPSLVLPFATGSSSSLHATAWPESGPSYLDSSTYAIDPSLLLGGGASPAVARASAPPKPIKSFSIPYLEDAIPARTFFPPASAAQSPPPAQPHVLRPPTLYGDWQPPSSRLEERDSQVAALSSFIATSVPSAAGPSRTTRTTTTHTQRSRSLSTGRAHPAGPSSGLESRRASINVASLASAAPSSPPSQTMPLASSAPAKSWLEQLREAEARAKLAKLQQQPPGQGKLAADGSPRGRMAQLHGQLMAQSIQEEISGLPAYAPIGLRR
ncbi:uncharacterized protein JCM10292_006192 [Rhodotorula paludigena]|uniref:uncharacterized protein n=1 Tax=Rhodotorula paludigena TaxID=86838 RepID=UPI0031808BF9